MTVCSGILKGSVFDCDNPLIPGIKAASLQIGNLDDIATVTFDATNKTKITGITMATGKQMWKFEGFRS